MHFILEVFPGFEFEAFLKDQMISIIFLLVIGVIQVSYFFSNRAKLKSCEKLFPTKDCYHKEEVNDIPQIAYIEPGGEFESIREQTNSFLKNNPSAMDIAEIKDIANRYADTKFAEASSHISLPMYLGLMGTYAGVALGLVMLFLGQTPSSEDINAAAELSDEATNVGEFIKNSALFQFIGGVIVAMLTSLIGLIATTWNSNTAAKAEETMEKRKEGYFSFLQTQIFPSTPSTLASTLNNSVNRLRSTVNSLTENLTKAFSGITAEFGKNLHDNLKKIDETVGALNNSTQVFKSAMDKHEQVVAQMLSPEYIAALDRIQQTVELCGGIADKVEQTNEGLATTIQRQETAAANLVSLASTQTSFVDTQKAINQETERAEQEFVQNLGRVQEMFGRIEAILNRFTSFEENVNTFAQAEIGRNTGALEQIDDQIRQIRKVRERIREYLQENEAGLVQHLDANRDAIKRAADKFKDDWGRIFYEMDPEHLLRPEQFYERLIILENKLNDVLVLLPQVTNKDELIQQIAQINTGVTAIPTSVREGANQISSGQRQSHEDIVALKSALEKKGNTNRASRSAHGEEEDTIPTEEIKRVSLIQRIFGGMGKKKK